MDLAVQCSDERRWRLVIDRTGTWLNDSTGKQKGSVSSVAICQSEVALNQAYQRLAVPHLPLSAASDHVSDYPTEAL